MINRKYIIAAILNYLIFMYSLVSAQDRTVGLFLNDSDSYDGYTLFAPLASTKTYIIDNEGRLIHIWEGTHRPGMSAYLLENGNLLRTAVINNPYFGVPFSGPSNPVAQKDRGGTPGSTKQSQTDE